MRGQDEHEEKILRAFFATLGVDRAALRFERTGPSGTSPDFKVTLRDGRLVAGVELTGLTTQADERTPRVAGPLADELERRLHKAIEEKPSLSARLIDKRMILEMSGLPREHRTDELVPRLITWVENLPTGSETRYEPQDPELREIVRGVRLEEGLGGPPGVWLLLAGRSDIPSALERLQKKRRLAQAPDFVRFDETWLVMYGVMASLCARTDALRPEVLREATDCMARRIFDRIYLFDTGKKEVWRFGWEIVTEL